MIGEAAPLPSNLYEVPNEFVLEETDFTEFGEKSVGKVRDIYTLDNEIMLVATDRYSAFDRNLTVIPFKGEIVNRISNFWFEATDDIIENHFVAMPDPNVMVSRRCEVLPVEVVMRGFITGTTDTSLWVNYQRGQRDFGNFSLSDGLQKNQQLDFAVLTPTTKHGEHDKPLTPERVVSEGYVDPSTWEEMKFAAQQLFAFGQEMALSRGLILVDTKYEFGLLPDGELILVDEVHTPDSSRYWRRDNYIESLAAQREPDFYDKEFLRLWYWEQSDPYKDLHLPVPPPEVIAEMTRRYVHVYEQLMGQHFNPYLVGSIEARIRHNLNEYIDIRREL